MVIAIIMISVADSGQLVRFFIFSVWLFHGTAMLALIVLRVKNKDKVRPYKVRLSESCPFLILVCFLPPQRLFLSACAYLKNILILRFVPSVCVCDWFGIDIFINAFNHVVFLAFCYVYLDR